MKMYAAFPRAGRLAAFGLLATLLPAQDLRPAKIEWDVFAGGQLFHKRGDPLRTKLLNSAVIGTRLTQNLWNHWSLEQSFSGSTLADLTLQTIPGASASRTNFEHRVWQFGFNPVYHLTPRESRVRPYFTLGLSVLNYNITDEGRSAALALRPFAAANLRSETKPGLNYGGGIKARITDLMSLRFDVRGLWTGNPNFGLPGSGPAGALFIPNNGSMNGMQVTGGIGFNFGKGRAPAKATPTPAPAPAPAPAPKAERTFRLGSISARPSTTVWVGESIDHTVEVTDTAPSGSVVYEWTVDGKPVLGASGPSFRFTPSAPGTYQVAVTAKDGALTSSAGPLTDTAKAVTPLTLSAATSKTDLKATDTADVRATADGGEYGGRIRYRWTASEGTITPTDQPTARYDASSVTWDPAQMFRPQSKTITITVTATDERNRSERATLQLRLTRDPQAMRLDDLIFANGSGRVNNCGKRILIDELYALLANNPDLEVLLIGHSDAAEAKKTPRVDRERVLNVAAVLSAGTGICTKCELTRIKVDWVGTDQTSDYRSGFCGTSSRQKSDERKADEIAADDAAAKNRRVEIWVLPKGIALPAAAKDPKPAPAAAIKARGCPR
jgi:flagellar motor protein MotB/opacity protein-like surface antigen